MQSVYLSKAKQERIIRTFGVMTEQEPCVKRSSSVKQKNALVFATLVTV